MEMYLIASRAKEVPAVKQKLAELEIQQQRYAEFVQEVHAGADAYQKGPSGNAEAISRWRKALTLCPDHRDIARVYSNLGDAALRQGDLDEALKQIQKAVKLRPEEAAWANNLGVVFDRRGDAPKACAYFKKGCSLGEQAVMPLTSRNQVVACRRVRRSQHAAPGGK